MLRLFLFAAVCAATLPPVAATADDARNARSTASHVERYTAAQVQRAVTMKQVTHTGLRGGVQDAAPRVVRMNRHGRTYAPFDDELASNSHGVTVFRGGVAGFGRSCVTSPVRQGVRVYANCHTPHTPVLAGGD